jgi:hypothetical protein
MSETTLAFETKNLAANPLSRLVAVAQPRQLFS